MDTLTLDWLVVCLGLAFLTFCVRWHWRDWPSKSISDGGDKVVNGVNLRLPPIRPHPQGQVETITPQTYRPYKWGPGYHVTMALQSLPWDEWIELDRRFPKYQRIREWRMKAYPDRVIGLLGDRVLKSEEGEEIQVSSAAPAARELLEEVATYLPHRYPANFERTRAGNIVFRLAGTEHAYSITSGVEECLQTIASLTQDDFILMQQGTDGRYYLQGGVLCNAGSWRLRDKLGMRLDEIHLSGNVPRFKEKLQIGMERFFRRLPVDKPVVRLNYGIQQVPENGDGVDPEEFAWSSMTMGPEDQLDHDSNDVELEALRMRQLASENGSSLRLRVERQTLRRLPKSGAIVFGIRTYYYGLDEIAAGEDWERLQSALRSWPLDVQRYKGWGGKLYEALLDQVR